MITIETVDQGRIAVTNLLMSHGSSIQEATRNHLVTALAQGKVQSVVDAHEALYADHTNLPQEGRDVLLGLNEFIVKYEFYGIMADDRGPRMALAVRRGTIDAGSGPAVDPRFVPQIVLVDGGEVAS